MPIRTEKAPPRSVAVVERTLTRLLAEPQFRRRAKVGSVEKEPLSLSTPHSVYSVGVDELLRGGLKAAEPTSTRFIILQGDRTLGSAETRLEGDRPGAFANVAQGPEVDGFVEGLARTEALDRVAKDDFELRALRINELHVHALWLKGASGTDVIVPIEPSPEPFAPGRALEVDEFLRFVAEAAERRPDSREPVEG
ncbi:MAG: hypothetical protein ACR2MO_05895 [Acidimicrobiales bacterium]